MRTTINLDEGPIAELMNVTGAKKKREAIHRALLSVSAGERGRTLTFHASRQDG